MWTMAYFDRTSGCGTGIRCMGMYDSEDEARHEMETFLEECKEELEASETADEFEFDDNFYVVYLNKEFQRKYEEEETYGFSIKHRDWSPYDESVIISCNIAELE